MKNTLTTLPYIRKILRNIRNNVSFSVFILEIVRVLEDPTAIVISRWFNIKWVFYVHPLKVVVEFEITIIFFFLLNFFFTIFTIFTIFTFFISLLVISFFFFFFFFFSFSFFFILIFVYFFFVLIQTSFLIIFT